MGCYNCSNLDPSKKKPGKVSGNLYYCKKLKDFVNPYEFNCNNFDKTYSRKSWENDEIYKDGKSYYDNDTPLWVYSFVLIALIILGLILGVFW